MLTAGAWSAMAALPEPLYNGPVNYTGSAPGSYTYDEATGMMSIVGCGSDIWGTSDQFYFVYTTQETDTDFDYYVKIYDLSGNSNGWMKAGLMVRESEGYTYDEMTGEPNGLVMAGGARYFNTQTQKSSGSSNGQWVVQWREENDQDVNDDRCKRPKPYTWPQWQRIRRIGNTYYGMTSTDGENWELMWSEDTDKWGGGPMVPYEGATPLAVGVFTTSHDANNNDCLCTASDFQAFPQTPVAFVSELNGADITAAQNYTFSATVSGYSPFEYVWKKDGKVIAQGTELINNTFTYKVDTAQLSDSGTYTLEVTNTANGQVTTKISSAKLNVTVDTEAPEVVSAQAFENTVGVTFNEAVDSASATQAANYSVAGKTVTKVEQRLSDRVTLILNGKVAVGSSVDVTVKNIKDLSGNMMEGEVTLNAQATFALSITGQPFTAGYAEALGGDGFFINNQGLVNWDNYDEDTFVCKAFTGDFDIRMRVVNQSYTTQWGRAGIEIRSALDNGKPAPHSSYMEIHNTPLKVMSWDESIGGYTTPVDNIQGVNLDDYRHSIQSNWRLTNGGGSDQGSMVSSIVVDGKATAPSDFLQDGGKLWLRIGRSGSTINSYYGVEQGGNITWIRHSSKTLEGLGAVAYGGPHYGIEGNNFGACEGLTNEFKNPTSFFFMSAVDYQEGYLQGVELLKSPVGVTLTAPEPLTLSVTATGDPIAYQWYKDGKAIEGAIASTYRVDSTTAEDAGTYTCEIMNFGSGAPDKGTSVMSAGAVVTIYSDTEAPTVESYSFYPGDKSVTLNYSESMDAASVSNPANYIIKGTDGSTHAVSNLTVSDNRKQVVFFCNTLENGNDYTIELGDITDPAGNQVTYDPMPFTVLVYLNGIVINYYDYDSGSLPSIGDFVNAVGNGTATPTSKLALDYLEIPTARGDYYCVFVKGLLVPPETGNYRFAVASDDESRLYLSTDATPANKTLVAEEPSWCNSRGFDTGAGGNQAPTQSGDIYLEAGKYYYFEGYMRENDGGDNFAVAWSLPSQGPTRVPDNATPISSAYVLDLDSVINPANTVLEIVSQPPATVTAYENGSVSLPVEVNYSSDLGYDVAPYYTWYVKSDITQGAWIPVTSVDFTPNSVTGALTPILQFKNLQGWEHNGVYRLDMVLAGKSLSSQEITLNVLSDTEAPTAVVKGDNSMENVTVQFSEAIGSGIEDPSNYSIDGLEILNVEYNDAQDVAYLTTARQEPGKVYTLKMKNISDYQGNTIPSNYSVSFTAYVWAPGYVILECFDDESTFAELFETVSWNPYNHAYRLPLQVNNYIEILTTTFNQDYCVERVKGYLAPEETGTYEFAGACDDDMKLWISPTESVADMSDDTVCWEQGWNNNGHGRRYDWKYQDGTEVSHGTRTIDLTGGQKYYFNASLREASGGDFLTLTWRLLPNPMQDNDTAPILTGKYIGIYANPDAANITIKQQPADFAGVVGDTASFYVGATGVNEYNAPLQYQWYVNGQAVEGATSATCNLLLTSDLADAQVYCELSVPGKTATTDAATITLAADVDPVTPIQASAVGKTLVVAFDRAVDPESATDISNYSVIGAFVTDAQIHGNEFTVQLTLDTALEGIFMITVSNVKNLSGVTMPAPVTIEGGATTLTYTNLNPTGIAPYAIAELDGDYTLYAGGGDYWNDTEYGCLYLYEAVEGDFDVVLCVESIENNNVWSKVGLAFRATLDGNSAHASMLATPERVQMTCRPTAGAASEDVTVRNYGSVTYPSNWIRLTRVGDVFTAYRSLDGNYWTYVGEVTESKAQLPAAGYLGIVYSTQDQSNYHTAVVSGYDSQYVAPDLPTPDPNDYKFTMVGYQDGGVEGFYDYDAVTGVFSVWGCGSDIWGDNDHFSYLYRPAPEGDFTLTVKLENFPASANGWAKAGLMVREGDADGGFPDNSRYVLIQTQRAYASDNSSFRSSWRNVKGLNVGDNETAGGPVYSYPNWQRIERVGGVISCYYSMDGKDWTLFTETITNGWADGAMGSSLPLYVGMWVTSHTTESSDACGYFSNVTFVGGDVPPVTDLELSYSIEGDNLVLRWDAASGASLEVAPTADSANWTILKGELVGGAYQCSVPMTEAAGFYRLTK